ncbi:unnamed protein product [Didymodactylos carnosus]|uniref:Uncharacterized protein n=1 Tax=Didymodactylos carnosus TaxID=1234261 RepID=A0A8S2U251_9BILA|nr:unnamed protein product [Didymodactylos carnosus]CAF4319842.1 unnamed protein product [Didymodactylos carnosus]
MVGQYFVPTMFVSVGNNRHEGKFYIGQTLKTLLEQYDDPRIIVTVCETSHYNDGQQQPISDETKLIRKFVPLYIVHTQAIHTRSLNIKLNEFEREKQAYLKCLKANFDLFPSVNYVLFLQDDAKPIEKFFLRTLLYLIDQRFKQWKEKPAFLKIYHPRWLLDYLKHLSFYIIVQLFSMSLLLTFIIYTYLYYRYYSLKPNNVFSKIYYYLENKKGFTLIWHVLFSNEKINYFLYYFLLITTVLFLLNHSNVSWSWRRLHPSLYAIYQTPSCCLPAVIYFRQTYSYVYDYLYKTQCNEKYAIDTAFDNLPQYYNYKLRTLVLEPNLIHHIGLYSRLRQSYINPYLID